MQKKVKPDKERPAPEKRRGRPRKHIDKVLDEIRLIREGDERLNTKEVWPFLVRMTRNAVNGRADGDIHETYGQTVMAFSLGAITKEQYYILNDILVASWINGGADHERKAMEALRALPTVW